MISSINMVFFFLFSNVFGINLEYEQTYHSECLIPQWRGNGICEDTNNIAACNFDGGDCCGPNVSKQYCEECKCYNMTESHKG